MGGIVKKAKGLNSKTLEKNDYIEMYKGNDVKTGLKTSSATNYYQGSVVINEETITLNAESYLKRTKIYEHNIWIDTKPLLYNK